ncbi:MAG: 4-hydroxy-tetrahydrodipicolinate synthase [Ruminococcaceae bacterium]|nr:4-hydroxy-tetrahydrodipicolinate synthase [Oscillospiraceae bacterium]
MGKSFIFRGVGTAIVTPFYEGGIDYETLGRLIDIQREYADALIVAGTTGEAPTLSETERDELLAFSLARTDGKIPVIMGIGSNDTAHAVRFAKRASELGANGVLAVTPYYNRGTQEGVRRHFLEIAEASAVPVILYNVPTRTGGNLTFADYEALLPHPNVAGVKEAEENTEKFFALCEAFGNNKAIYTGSDAFLLPSLALGGAGVISVISNLYPKAVHTAIRAFVCGDIAGARRSFGDLFPLCRLLFAETSPAPVKEALRLMGYGNGECRLPLTAPSKELSKLLSARISHLST